MKIKDVDGDDDFTNEIIKNEKVECDIYAKVFARKCNLKRHKMGVHDKVKNFQCNHCCAEHYMDRHLLKITGSKEVRRTVGLEQIRELSKQADEFGLARFVITGGEPLVRRNPSFDEVVVAIDPDKHYIITDTNGWFMDEKKAKHIKSNFE